MRAAPARHAGDVLAEEDDAAAIGAQLAGNEIEERRLARAVRPDDQAPLAGFDGEIDMARDAQAAKGLLDAFQLERGHGRPSTGRSGRLSALQPRRRSRADPGTKPSGMKRTMRTKTAPSARFQRSI